MDQQQFDGLVKLFEEAKDGSGNPLQMEHLLIKQGNNEYLHTFRGHTGPSDIRSISKTVLTLVLGTVIESRDDLTEDTPVWPVLKNLCEAKDPENLEKWQHIKIKHLMNHTIGFDRILMMRGDIQDMDPADYINYIVNEPIVHEAGTYYLYSNAGFYLMSIYLQEFLGEDLEDYIRRTLFNPLGITDYRWERYGKYLAGATRLWLLPRDMLKIGELLLEGGKGIVSPQWIERMKQFTAFTPPRGHAYKPVLPPPRLRLQPVALQPRQHLLWPRNRRANACDHSGTRRRGDHYRNSKGREAARGTRGQGRGTALLAAANPRHG